MTILRGILLALLTSTVSASAQTIPAGGPVQAMQTYGSVTILGKSVNAGNKNKLSLARKRFYLFAGGVKENTALIERINATEITSRDCYYTQINASACLIDWLAQENCETPFCRKIEKDDLTKVKEFEAAYNKGLPLYGRKPNIALDWVANNLPVNIASGFYLQQKSSIQTILKGQKPVESAMTTAAAALATFANIPVGDKPGTFLVSNVLPVEVGNKSYVWICEVSVGGNKEVKLPLNINTDPAKRTKGCTVTMKDLKTCSTGTCEKK